MFKNAKKFFLGGKKSPPKTEEAAGGASTTQKGDVEQVHGGAAEDDSFKTPVKEKSGDALETPAESGVAGSSKEGEEEVEKEKDDVKATATPVEVKHARVLGELGNKLKSMPQNDENDEDDASKGEEQVAKDKDTANSKSGEKEGVELSEEKSGDDAGKSEIEQLAAIVRAKILEYNDDEDTASKMKLVFGEIDTNADGKVRESESCKGYAVCLSSAL